MAFTEGLRYSGKLMKLLMLGVHVIVLIQSMYPKPEPESPPRNSPWLFPLPLSGPIIWG